MTVLPGRISCTFSQPASHAEVQKAERIKVFYKVGSLCFLSSVCRHPTLCFLFLLSFFFSSPSKHQPPHLFGLHMPHEAIFTFFGFLHCEDLGSYHGIPSLLLPSHPPPYICYSLHPAIRILLTLACLIRVRQRKIKTKASPFFPPRPSTCPLPPSRASSFLSPPSHSTQLDHMEIALIDLLKPHLNSHGNLKTSSFLVTIEITQSSIIHMTGSFNIAHLTLLLLICRVCAEQLHCWVDCKMIFFFFN